MNLFFLFLVPFIFSNWVLTNGDPTSGRMKSLYNTSDFHPGNRPGVRFWPATVQRTQYLSFMYGGIGYHLTGSMQGLCDLWCYHSGLNMWRFVRGGLDYANYWDDATYADFPFDFDEKNLPGGRAGGVMFNNPYTTNTFFLFGGLYVNSEMWEFDIHRELWALVELDSPAGSYKKEWNITNAVAGRYLPAIWVVESLDDPGSYFIYIFGGKAISGNLNDLNVYDIDFGLYKWVRGENYNNPQSKGNYGTRREYNQDNEPPARHGPSYWQRGNTHLYLFNGRYDVESSNHTFLNDMWVYNISGDCWKWIVGNDKFEFVGSTVVMKGVFHGNNVPGSRMDSYKWNIGTFDTTRAFLYGGDYFTNMEYLYGDTWEFDMITERWRCLQYCDGSEVVFINREYNLSEGIIYGRTAGATFKSWRGDPMLFAGYPDISDIWTYENVLSRCRGVSIYEKQWHCSGHGTCKDDLCTCHQDYVGDDCEFWYCYLILNANATVCSGKGECKSKDVCECQTHPVVYFGDECEIYSCFGVSWKDENVCSGVGNCTDVNQCECEDDFYGENCNITECFGIRSNNESVCGGRGICTMSSICRCDDEKYPFVDKLTEECECLEGYYGPACEDSICYGPNVYENLTCSGYGNCTMNGTYEYDSCDCVINHLGISCEITKCPDGYLANDTRVCSGRGRCVDFECICDPLAYAVDPNSNFCECRDGFYGRYCNETVCFTHPGTICSGHGTCTIEGELTTDNCECDEKWYSFDCSVTECYGVFTNTSEPWTLCSGWGDCVGGECVCFEIMDYAFGNCSCITGFYGRYCNTSLCFDAGENNDQNEDDDDDDDDEKSKMVECGNHGYCVYGGSYHLDECVCDKGWTSLDCDQREWDYDDDYGYGVQIFMICFIGGCVCCVIIILSLFGIFLIYMVRYWLRMRNQQYIYDAFHQKPSTP